jgi:hypothetical protein
MAEVMRGLEDDPSEELKHFAFGMRYAAGLLGMPEGSSTYDWTLERSQTQGIPIQGLRATRRDKILRALTRR